MFFIITFESMTIVSLIPRFELKLVLMFFCIDSISELKTSIQIWHFATLAMIAIVIKGREIIGVKNNY